MDEHKKEEMKKKLPEDLYEVAVNGGTEAPFTGEYIDEKTKGTYNCKVCGNPLFSSEKKFDSGTGWPSFDEALPGAIKFNEDDSHGMKRTEVVCAKCGSHLGHVFEDGPTKTGKRYCMNSICLNLDEE